MNYPPPDGLDELLRYPLIDAIMHRRSRRFALGAELNGGRLAYRSMQPPIPLTPLEEAMLTFASAGFTGMALAELPYDEGEKPEAGGGNVMVAFTGRAGASADAVHSTTLFILNDEGTFLVKRPQDYPARQLRELLDLVRQRQYLALYREGRVLIKPGRTQIPETVPEVLPFNKWSTNLSGTTYFLPVSDLSGLYINLILSAFDEQIGAYMVDERNNFAPAGIRGFERCHGGHLWCEPSTGRVVSIQYLEAMLLEFVLAEQAFMCHNLSLMEQAMGLGGWTHCASGSDVAWFEALGFTLGKQSVSQVLNAGVVKRLYLKATGQNLPLPHALGLTVEGKDLIRPFCPPYYESMRAAVLSFVELKRQNIQRMTLHNQQPGTWQNLNTVQESIPNPSDSCIEATIRYCSYIYETYGRFPAYYGPLRTTLAHQAHHLDLEFYDQHYHGGAYTETQATHFEKWHKDLKD